MTVKLARENIKLMLSINKYNISFLSIGEVDKFMLIVFHDSKTTKNIKFQKLKSVILQNLTLHLTNAGEINKF